MDTRSLDRFTQAYIECALWSTTDNADESGGEALEYNFGIDDIAPESLQAMVDECRWFQDANAELLSRAGDDEQNGHDYWLTRNQHGAGFWDRGYDGKVGHALTLAAHYDGSVDLYVGDDGKLHQS